MAVISIRDLDGIRMEGGSIERRGFGFINAREMFGDFHLDPTVILDFIDLDIPFDLIDQHGLPIRVIHENIRTQELGFDTHFLQCVMERKRILDARTEIWLARINDMSSDME